MYEYTEIPQPYNPAKHGGVLEDYRNMSRSGSVWFFIGVMMLSIAAVSFYFYMRDGSEAFMGIAVPLFWVTLGAGIMAVALGVANLTDAQAFASRVKFLTTMGNGLVIRGSVVGVRQRYRIFGATLFTKPGDSLNMDTGWVYKVDYVFQCSGRQRRATGVVPDHLGPNRANNNATTFIDPNQPRVGLFVDILFCREKSVILRFIQPGQ